MEMDIRRNLVKDLAEDLRDEREALRLATDHGRIAQLTEQLKTLKTYAEAKFAAETRLTELLTIAVEALEWIVERGSGYYKDHRVCADKARTALDRIKGIG